jgi:hypothetical protein
MGSGPLTDPLISDRFVAIHLPSDSFLNAEQFGLMLSGAVTFAASTDPEHCTKPKHSDATTNHPKISRANSFLTSNNLMWRSTKYNFNTETERSFEFVSTLRLGALWRFPSHATSFPTLGLFEFGSAETSLDACHFLSDSLQLTFTADVLTAK